MATSLSPEEAAARLAYWTAHLAGVPTLQLPTDYPRPPSHKARAAGGAWAWCARARSATDGRTRRWWRRSACCA
jgi:hypothetical protein